MKTRFTKAELIAQWLERWPKDKDAHDLEFNAVSLYVECKDGSFVHYKQWTFEKRGGLKPCEDA